MQPIATEAFASPDSYADIMCAKYPKVRLASRVPKLNYTER